MANIDFFERIEEFLDNELSPEMREQFERELQVNETLQEALLESRHIRQLIHDHFEYEELLAKASNWYDTLEIERQFQESMRNRFSVAEKIISGVFIAILTVFFLLVIKDSFPPIPGHSIPSIPNVIVVENDKNPYKQRTEESDDSSKTRYVSKMSEICICNSILSDSFELKVKKIADVEISTFSENINKTLNTQTMSSQVKATKRDLLILKINVDSNKINYSQAISELGKLIIDEGDSIVFLHFKTYLYYKEGDLNSAINYYKEYKKIDFNKSTDKDWYLLVLYLADAKKYQKEICLLWEKVKNQESFRKRIDRIEKREKIVLFCN